MRTVDTIIIGGGPAGASCAAGLVRAGRDVLVLDRAEFPREKLCAGWITEKVMRDLDFTPGTYPNGILPLKIRTHFPRLPFGLSFFPTPGANYSIRRVEFDAWLLQRSGAPFARHQVKEIVRDGDGFVIDGQYSCRHLVGAGGTMCPVRRAFFPDTRKRRDQIVTLEREFEYPARGDLCRLYFFRRGLSGYSWYVPKANGVVNIGIGGKANWFRRQDTTIHDHLKYFLADLRRDGLLDEDTVEGFRAHGHPYYIAGKAPPPKAENVWLAGDSAGLASVDLGEGIGPAIESGQMVAAEITGTGRLDAGRLTRFSTSGMVRKFAAKAFGPGPQPAAAA